MEASYPHLIAITKNNPTNWSVFDPKFDRYFHNLEEIENSYNKGDFQKMLTIRKILTPLKMEPYLEEIVIDNPQLKKREMDKSRFEIAKDAIINAANIGGLNLEKNIKIIERNCQNCFCLDNYKYQMDSSERDRLFNP